MAHRAVTGVRKLMGVNVINKCQEHCDPSVFPHSMYSPRHHPKGRNISQNHTEKEKKREKERRKEG
jgi:hypothetical protein